MRRDQLKLALERQGLMSALRASALSAAFIWQMWCGQTECDLVRSGLVG